MRHLLSLAATLALVAAFGSLQGCGSSQTEVGGVTPEFRKADLASQDAMRGFMQSSAPKGKGKAKGKGR